MTAKLYNFRLERARRHAAKLPDSHYGWDCLTSLTKYTEFTEAELSELQQALGSEVKT